MDQINNKKKKKQLVINCEKLETRVALIRNSRLEEYQIERTDEERLVGSIFLGKIVNMESSLQAAFVDIGLEKNAFLHYWDMIPSSYDKADKLNKTDENEKATSLKEKTSSIADKIKSLVGKGNKAKQIQDREKSRRRKKIDVADVPKQFKVGMDIIIQVTKGPIGTKGPRVTTNLSIPGRYLVLLPFADHIGLSKKISDKKERSRLKKILNEFDLPEGIGLICRTVGEGRKSDFFKRDLDMLLEAWQKVDSTLLKAKKPTKLYSEPNLIERSVRDFLTEDIDEIIVDDEAAYKTLYDILSRIASKKFANKVVCHRKAMPLFEHLNIKKQIAEVFQRQVQLRSGGYICIDETEALIAIDVNTGKARRGKDQPEIILKTNLEAAEEVARQLRVRNIGGLVVIDFIDMRPQKHRDQVLKLVRKLVKEDRAKSKILPISRLGLMEMTRQREHESLRDTVYDPCPYCNGKGLVKSSISMSVEIQRKLQEVLRRRTHEKDLNVKVIIHPTILARLKNEDASVLMEVEKKYGKRLTFRGDDSLHHEEFKLEDSETGKEFR